MSDLRDDPDRPLVLVSRRVVTPERVEPAAVIVTGGRIDRVTAHPEQEGTGQAGMGQEGTGQSDTARLPASAEVVDLGDLAVLPGLVDSHVHVNEPGRTHWEGFATATRAAAAGGISTLVDMPLNSLPPTTDPAALAEKRAAAGPQAHVDVAFWGGLVPGSEERLAELRDAGVRGVKAFLCDSGVPEYGCFAPGDAERLLAATAEVGLPLLVHAEDPVTLDRASREVVAGDPDPRRHRTWLDTRPAEAEIVAVRALVDAARRTGGHVHVLHVSAAEAAELIAAARGDGVPVTAETCPHYLTLAAEDVPHGATIHKCAPPIRDAANAERLWRHLAAGDLDAVVSDHSPSSPDEKAVEAGDFMAAWGGIASLQLGLPVVWTAARERGHDLADLARWMAAEPARLAGLDRKGAISPGHDADLTIVDPDEPWTIDAARLEHRHPLTPYADRRVTGAVRRVYLRGRLIARDGAPLDVPQGRLLPDPAGDADAAPPTAPFLARDPS
ncbi:allantoinase AllB [Egibacter rhizosphaerae]|uniref:allantoinase n=1 Tax=Egibacter rhizosphaerae TaxID=1670831 RepID=A0A411YEX1_9ACTN|nr:allantoinase AllB [Egibacter rhizosphaerae]QBI19746.1 allantoinase AllB [Egibacter rhizosphaerae]